VIRAARFAELMDVLDHGGDRRALRPTHAAGGITVSLGLRPGFRGDAAAAVVALDLVVNRPAQKLVDGLSQRLAENVPLGNVDGADRGGQRTTAPPRTFVQILPDSLDGGGILADENFLAQHDRGGHRLFLAAEVGFAHSDQPLICIDLHKGRARSDIECLDVRNLEIQRLGLGNRLGKEAFSPKEAGDRASGERGHEPAQCLATCHLHSGVLPTSTS